MKPLKPLRHVWKDRILNGNVEEQAGQALFGRRASAPFFLQLEARTDPEIGWEMFTSAQLNEEGMTA